MKEPKAATIKIRIELARRVWRVAQRLSIPRKEVIGRCLSMIKA